MSEMPPGPPAVFLRLFPLLVGLHQQGMTTLPVGGEQKKQSPKIGALRAFNFQLFPFAPARSFLNRFAYGI